MENNKFQKVTIKNCMYFYEDDITKVEDFDLSTFLLDEKSYENTLIFDISCNWFKTIRLDEIDGYNIIFIELDAWLYSIVKNMMPFILGLVTLKSKKKGYCVCFFPLSRNNQS